MHRQDYEIYVRMHPHVADFNTQEALFMFRRDQRHTLIIYEIIFYMKMYAVRRFLRRGVCLTIDENRIGQVDE